VQAVENAVRAGLVVITASGNFGVNPRTGRPGYAGVTSPGNAPSAITIGALNTFETVSRADDRIADYSSRGPTWYDAFTKPDVTAPGHNMLSVAAKHSYLRKQHEERGGSGNYMRLSGTSMRPRWRAASSALLIEANPYLTPNALKAVLEFTAIPVKRGARKPTTRLRRARAASNGAGGDPARDGHRRQAPVGAKWLLNGMHFKTTIARTTLQVGANDPVGPHHVIGDGLIDENRIAWANNIVWGSGVDEYNIVWGTRPTRRQHRVGTAYDEGDKHRLGHQHRVEQRLRRRRQHCGARRSKRTTSVWGTNIVWATHWLASRKTTTSCGGPLPTRRTTSSGAR